MNADYLKFGEVFIDFIDNGKVVNDKTNLMFRLEQKKAECNQYMRNWTNFLSDKYESMDEARYDDWYDNLEYEQLTFDELSTYHLPLEKFVVEFNDFSYFLEIIDIFKNTYNKLDSLIGKDSDKFLIQLDVSPLGIVLDIILLGFIPPATEDENGETKTYKVLANAYEDRFKQLKAAYKTGNDAAWAVIKNIKKTNSNVSYNPNLIQMSNQSLTKLDSNSTEEENEERRRNAEMFSANNIRYFKRLQITDSSFIWAKGKDPGFKIEDYISKIFKNLPTIHMCNCEGTPAYDMFGLV